MIFSLKDPSVFDLIRKHQLFDSITDKIAMLMKFDRDKALQLFLENVDRIPVRNLPNISRKIFCPARGREKEGEIKEWRQRWIEGGRDGRSSEKEGEREENRREEERKEGREGRRTNG